MEVKVQQGNCVAKEKVRLVRGEEDKSAFEGAFKKEIAEFRLHVSRIKINILSYDTGKITCLPMTLS